MRDNNIITTVCAVRCNHALLTEGRGKGEGEEKGASVGVNVRISMTIIIIAWSVQTGQNGAVSQLCKMGIVVYSVHSLVVCIFFTYVLPHMT